MVIRKILIIILVLIFSWYFKKDVYAGTCRCQVTNDRNGTGAIVENNCDSTTEYYQCTGGMNPSGGYTEVGCNCIKKENSGLAANSCTCSGTGIVTGNNCQDSVPYCNTRGTTVCICTANGTIDTVGEKTSEVVGKGKRLDTYNPFTGCNNNNDINTALGCIPTTVELFVPWLLKYLFGIAGGIAFLLMVYGFILIATSGGDEKKVAGAKETITSAVVGLLVCIFAIFILRLVAVNILHIPGIN